MASAPATIDCTYEVEGGWRALRDALQRIRMEAEDAVREGRGQVILDDRGVSESAGTRADDPGDRCGAQPSGRGGAPQL